MGFFSNLLFRKTPARGGTEQKSFDPFAAGGPSLRMLVGAGGIFGSVNLAKLAEAPQTDEGRIALAGNHPIVFMCIRKIAWSVASVPWMATYQGQQVPVDHPLVRFINKPDPTRSRWELYQLLAASLAASGNAYLLKVPPAVEQKSPTGQVFPGALLFLRPDRMKPYINPTRNEIEYYDYWHGAVHQRLNPQDVIHIRHQWLADDHLGYSVLRPGYEPTSLYASLVTLARKIAANIGGVPGMMVFTKPQGLSDTQRAELSDHISRFKSDGDKFGEILLVDVEGGDVKFVPIGGDISKMQPKESKADAAREIANLFGVPPMLLTQGENATFANMEEANRSFWLDTVIPGYVTPIADALTHHLGLEIAPDLSEVPALSKLNTNTVTMLNAASFLTINEKRAVTGYDPVAMGDRIMSSMGAIPLDTQVATQDANAVMNYDPKLLQAIIDAANQQLAAGKGDQEALERVVKETRRRLNGAAVH